MLRSYSAIFVVCWHAFIAQGCNDANLLHDIERRSRSDVMGTDPLVHDFFISTGWYITQHNGQQYHMPNARHMPSLFSCGTYYPTYLQGNETNFDNLTNNGTEKGGLIACIRTSNSDCQYELEIRVRKCGSNIQYYLEPTGPTIAYCFDPPEIQDVTNLTAAPTNPQLGDIKIVPTLGFDPRPYSVFICNFTALDDLFYFIRWSISGAKDVTIHRSPERGSNAPFIIVESELTKNGSTLSFNLQCSVQVAADVTGQKTPQKFSDSFFAGVKVLDPVLTIPRGGTGKIRFRLTIPVGCESDGIMCNLTISMINPLYQSDYSHIAFQRCGISNIPMYTNKTLGEWKSTDAYTMKVTNVKKDTSDARTYTLLLKVQDIMSHKLWRGHRMTTITVQINDTDRPLQICWSLVDPHMKTADGRRYENQNPGQYRLYQNTKYNITVDERHGLCNGGAYCTCGLRIQAGMDVYAIDGCSKPWSAYYVQCGGTNTLRVYTNETRNTYEIYTPIGTLIKVTLNAWGNEFMNVLVIMSPKDWNSTTGLCGDNDGNPDNDIPDNDEKTFLNLWNLPEDKSLFSPKFIKKQPEWNSAENLYCNCPEGFNQNATGPFPHSDCSIFYKIECFEYKSVQHNKCTTIRVKRDSGRSMQRNTQKMIFHTAPKSVATELKRSTRESSKVISKEQAHEYCSNVINEQAAVKTNLLGLTGQNVEHFIFNCAIDVQLANDMSASLPHVEVINSIVRYALDKDPVFVQKNNGLVTEFLRDSCVNNCSNKGVCNNKGLCECYEHFHDGDCGINEREPPVIYYVEGHSLCPQVEDDDCSCFKIYTADLMHSFSCQISGNDTLVDGSQRAMERTVVTGEYEDAFSAICCVPLELVNIQQVATTCLPRPTR